MSMWSPWKALVLIALPLAGAWSCQDQPAAPPTVLAVTDSPFDLAIDNDTSQPHRDYFVLSDAQGARWYTRDGRFRLNAAREVVHAETGLPLWPLLTLPADATETHIREDGLVLVRRFSQPEEHTEVGQVLVARFPNAANLVPQGPTLLRHQAAAGVPMIARPATRGLGKIRSGVEALPAFMMP
jgi:flagellar basal-body rod protein FlgG